MEAEWNFISGLGSGGRGRLGLLKLTPLVTRGSSVDGSPTNSQIQACLLRLVPTCMFESCTHHWQKVEKMIVLLLPSFIGLF